MHLDTFKRISRRKVATMHMNTKMVLLPWRYFPTRNPPAICRILAKSRNVLLEIELTFF